ncbi:hypothetical protein GCM10010166_11440 [Couchioplanes caeruleus subsp. azureus]|nr:hypothetical protein GCM10010166_11440 [Couchioplanes caeruleus subsp. azureus]
MESLTVPDKVTGFTAAPGDGTFLLTFDVPADGGSPITGFDYSTDNGSTWKPLTEVTGEATKQATISKESGGDGTVPLGYNIPYNLQVRAVNIVGGGAASDTFSATIPPKAPDAPHPTVGVVDGTITLSFTMPRDYGSPVTGWEYSTDNGISWKTLTVLGSITLTATITNESTGDGNTALQTGQRYQVRIHALNAVGTGQDTQTFTVDIPDPGAPAAPGSVSAAPEGGNHIGVDFITPSPGDSAIIKYQYSTDDGNTWRDTPPPAGEGTLHVELTVESNMGFPFALGGTYRVRIRAVNSQGAGVASAADEVDFPAAAPGAPFNLVVVPQAGSGFTLTFGQPPDNGSPITGYEYTTDGGAQWQPLTGVAGEMQKSADITNQSTGAGTTPLATGVAYQIRVHAVNALGPGPDSQTVTATIPNAGSPDAPGSVSALPAGENDIGVDFTAPSPGDSAIIKYQYSTDDGNTWRDTPPPAGVGPLHVELTVESNSGFPFARGHQYRVRIRAVNAQGPGMPSAADQVTLPVTAPGKPFDLSAVPRAEGGFTLAFGQPSDNGSPITGWQYTTDNGAHWQPLTGVAGDWQKSAPITNQSTGTGTTPLAGGESYQIRVRAVNEIGPGEDSDTVTASLPNAGSPAAPTAVDAVADGDRVGVNFTAPSPGDSAIIKYQYSTDDGNTWRDTPTTGEAPSLHADLQVESGSGFQLYPGQPYRIRIRAVNTQGPGMPSDAHEVTLPTSAPGRVYRLAVSPADEGGFALSFDSPPDNGSPITGYQYTTDNGVHWQPLTGVAGDWQKTAAITNQSTGTGTTPLAAGESYQIRVRAVNEIGPGEDSDTVTASLPNAGSPAKPTDVHGGPSEDGIGVDFTAPSPGDSAIIKYQYSTDDGNTWLDTPTTGEGPLHANLTVESDSRFPLANGNPYRIRIRAVNSQGPGMPSDAVELSRPPAAPGQPWDMRAEPGMGSVTLSFDAPSDNGSPITGWEYTTDNGAHWQPLHGVTGDWHSSVTITDESTGAGTTPLASGVTYQIRIRAINELGPGEDSETISVELPNPGSPARPGDVHGSFANGKISVDFTAPAQGDSPIIKYQYSTNGGNSWSDTTTTGAGTLHIEITAESGTEFPLYPGQMYRVRIRAVNAQGAGLPSATEEVNLPPTAPGAPFDVYDDPGDGQVTLTWRSSDNGSQITAYSYSTNDGTDWKPLGPLTFNDDWTTSATIHYASTGDGTTPLQNGQSYQVRIKATNELGTGPASEPITVALPLPGSPGRPTDLLLSPLDDRIGVDFTAPSPGDSAISKYQYSTDSGNSWRDIGTTGTTTRHLEITVESDSGLPLGRDNRYWIRVRAVNAQGAGVPSEPTEISLPPSEPSQPTGVTPVAGNQQVTVTFTVDSGGRELTSVEYSTDGGTTWRTLSGVTPLDEMTHRATITHVSSGGGVDRLTNGVTYQLRLRAANDIGPGTASDAVAMTPLAPPAAPTGVVATAQTATISVSWNASAPGGAPVTGYTAIASPGPATCDSTPTNPTSCIMGVQADKPYTITVVAHSASGDSDASEPSESVTAASPVIPQSPPPVDSPVLETPEQQDNKTAPGATITIKGSGYAPNSTVELVMYSAPISLGTVVTDDNGEFSVDVVVPPTLPVGNHSIATVGADPQGNVRAMRLDVTVARTVPVAPPPATTPPTTTPTAPPTTTPTTTPPTTTTRVVTKVAVGRRSVTRGAPTRATLPVIVTFTAAVKVHNTVVLWSTVSGERVVLGTGRATMAAASRRAAVMVTLNPLGRAMAATPGGYPVAVAATTVPASGRTLRASSRTRLILNQFTVPRAVFFATDSSRISTAQQRYLAALGTRLAGARAVTCIGRTDNRGNTGVLGKRRAAAVCRLLAARLDVTTSSITRGGATSSNSTAAERARNRRVDIMVRY